jgi:hypothetical protein
MRTGADIGGHAAYGHGQQALPAAKPMVFVVDDDPSVRKSLTRLLAAAKHTVEAFASAREFLAREPYERQGHERRGGRSSHQAGR